MKINKDKPINDKLYEKFVLHTNCNVKHVIMLTLI